ncbi:MAG: LamG domain-containing protein, partial [Planctomycetota bacterium]
MCRKLVFPVCVVLVLGLVNSASAATELKVDLVDAGEGEPWPYTFKGGDWIPWPAWPDDESDEAHDARSLIGVGGLDVNVGLASGCCSNVLETSDDGEEPLCNSWLESYEAVSGSPGADISLVIWGDGFTAGEYVVYAYHNDAETERSKMPLIHVGAHCDSNAVGNINAQSRIPDCNAVDVEQIHDEETNDVNVVIQNLSGAAGLDDNLVPSVVKFYTDGSPVLITYVSGDESNAIINAFIIVMPGAQVNAWRPEPGNGARDLCPADVNFYWTPGIYADDHNVYFGTSMDDVNESADAYTEHVAANSWTSPELKVDTTYYWRVETVNDVCAPYSWPGTVWTFSTRDGVAYDPLPGTTRGLPASAITELAWTASCFADTHKVYFGEDLPESVVLFDDGFESDFAPNWPVANGWEWFDANAVDPNLRHSGDYSARAISGGGLKTLTSADVNTADACSVRVELRFRKTVEIQDNEIKLYYWNASLNDYEFIKDLNSLDPNDQWLYYRDDMNESQYLISNFKIKLEANISSGGTVYIDDVKMTNTWPWSLRWYEGRENGNSHSVSLEALTKYSWRVDTVVDGNTIQGDHWTFSTGLGGVIMWLSFDGVLDDDIDPTVSAYTETGKTIEFAKYVIDGTVKYGEANPMNNRDGTSVVFDPCAGLYRLDPCKPSEIDPLRLDGYQYTIEMWVKPTNLSEPLMDDMVLISKGGESDEDDDGDEWQDGSWWVVIENPGTDDDDDNEFRFKRRGESTGMDEDSAVENEWCHIAVVYNQQHPDPSRQHSVFYNGNLDDSEDAGSLNRADNNSPVSIGFGLDDDANFADASNFFQGLIDEIRILDIALDPDEFLLIPGPEWASRPNPYNGQISIDPNDPNVVLSWTPGIYAQRHKVYFSTDFDDVNTGIAAALLGEYEVNEVNDVNLMFGQTYYWRVDEVNDTCSPYLWKGVIWKFTTSYMILDENLILWHRFDQEEGDLVIDYSGYGHHGDGDNVSDEHWEPTGGRFDGCLKFDNDIGIGVPETLFEGDNSISDKITVSVWLNGLSTQSADNDMAVFDVGDEDATYKITALVPSETPDFDVSWRAGNDSNDLLIWDTDRTIIKAWQGTWHHFVFIKDEAEGKMYIYFDGELIWWKEDTIISMTQLQGKEFRIGAWTDHGSDYEGRMDDFRVYNTHLSDEDILKLFRGGDLNVAWNPSPYDGQPDAPYDANLVWKPGDDANKHNVFFGTSEQEVANMTEPCAVKDLGDEDYEPGPLVLDKYYYWRIDEVNNIGDSCTWPGPVWSFKVADYTIIDDVESYNKTTNQIKDTWRDYWYQAMNPPYIATGGVLDLGIYPYNIVYPGGGGSQSMLYQFKNILWGTPGHDDAYAAVCYSEVSLPMPGELQNWTAGGVRVLRLYFYGDVDNDVNAPLYVGVKDGGNPSKYAEVRYGEYDPNNEDVNDVNEPEWHRWDIGLTHFKDSNFAA